jgi:hypothetical protein
MLRIAAEHVFLDAEGTLWIAHGGEGDSGLGHGDATDVWGFATEACGEVQEFGDTEPALFGFFFEEEGPADGGASPGFLPEGGLLAEAGLEACAGKSPDFGVGDARGDDVPDP